MLTVYEESSSNMLNSDYVMSLSNEKGGESLVDYDKRIMNALNKHN